MARRSLPALRWMCIPGQHRVTFLEQMRAFGQDRGRFRFSLAQVGDGHVSVAEAGSISLTSRMSPPCNSVLRRQALRRLA